MPVTIKDKDMKHEDVKMDKKVVKKAVKMHDEQLHGGKKTDLGGLKKGGTVKKMAKGGSASSRADGCAQRGKTKGTEIKMCGGGRAMGK